MSTDHTQCKRNLKNLLEDAIVRFQINQSQLAARVKVSQGTISQWLKEDSTQFPNEESRKAIAAALGMTYARFEAEIQGTPFNPEPVIGYTEVADYLVRCNLREFFLLLQDYIHPRILKETRIALVGGDSHSDPI